MIVIPTYNSAEFLEKTIASALAQTYSSPIVVVDNCSDDGTQAIVERYDGVELVVNRTNIGRIGNWNRCVEIAIERGGPFFKILFAGDIIKPNAMEKYKEVFDKHNDVGLVTSAYEIIKDGKTAWVNQEIQSSGVIAPIEGLKRNVTVGSWYGSPSVQAYRTDMINGTRFSVDLPWAADWQFCIDISARNPAYFIKEILAEFHADDRKYYFASRNKLSSAAEDVYVTTKVLDGLKSEVDESEFKSLEKCVRKRFAGKFITKGNIFGVLIGKIKNVVS